MDKNKLKQIVKEYFNLTEYPAAVATNKTTFGEIKDINGAFTIEFEGELLEVGKVVSVRTADGQTMAAPNGTHELEDGRKIVTEDSVVTEIHDAVALAAESFDEEVPVGNESMDAPMAITPEDLRNAIADLVQTEMAKHKDEMAKHKDAMSKHKDEMNKHYEDMKKEMMMEVTNQIKTIRATDPAIDRTVASTGAKQAYEAFTKSSPNAERMNMALNLLKNKPKN